MRRAETIERAFRGLDFQAQLQKANIRVPIIFMTGHGDIPMSVQAMKAGAVDFLTKPFRDQEMLDAVVRALERDQKPGAPGKRAPLEHVGEGDLGIEQHARRVRGERLDEVELEGAQRLDVGRKARLLARRDELGALIGRQDPQTAARSGQLVERTPFRDREHSCSFLSNLKHFRA